MRNDFLFVLKYIAAYFVIFIHCSFPADMGVTFNAIARFAVPFFFMISGYFAFNKNNAQITKNALRILKITIVACLVYIIYNIIISLPDYNSIKELFAYWFSKKSIYKLILFNSIRIANHLWFLSALLYCYLMMLVINKYRCIRSAYIIFGLFLLLNIICSFLFRYHKFGDPVMLILLTRNFWFTGAPFFLLGHCIHRYSQKFITIPNKYLYVMIIIGEVLSIIDVYCWGYKELYLGSCLAVFAIFILSLKYPRKFSNSAIRRIGQDYTSFIYLYHPIIISLLWAFLNFFRHNLWSDSYFQYFMPIFVCLVTTLIAYLFDQLKNIFHK